MSKYKPGDQFYRHHYVYSVDAVACYGRMFWYNMTAEDDNGGLHHQSIGEDFLDQLTYLGNALDNYKNVASQGCTTKTCEDGNHAWEANTRICLWCSMSELDYLTDQLAKQDATKKKLTLEKPKCYSHTWRHYQGIFEEYDFCEVCDEKQNKR